MLRYADLPFLRNLKGLQKLDDYWLSSDQINPQTPKDNYSGRNASLTSKRCILYIYSTNTDTEYFKHGIYSPFYSLQNTVCFIIITYLVPVLFAFYIQDVLKFKKIIPAPKVNEVKRHHLENRPCMLAGQEMWASSLRIGKYEAT